MKTSVKLFVIFLISAMQLKAQFCDSIVPSMNVDLSASPNMSWTSPLVSRNGHCCGTSNPDRCLEFVITLHPSAIAVNFSITSGAVPPGALFYQIGCGPVTPVGSPICLNGPGPHTLTFCKPGNNQNEYSITSYSGPIIGPDITLNAGCSNYIFANYYNEPSVSWTSIAPGAQGAYDSYLSCTSGCDTTFVTAVPGAPAFVDYLVCGNDIGGCNPNPICDTIRVNFITPVTVTLNAATLNLCAGQTTSINAIASGGSPAYSYLWNTLETSTSIIGGPGTYFVEVRDVSLCLVATDTIIINQFPIPVVGAGADQVVCEGTAVTLSGSGATSYVWDNGITDGVPFVQGVGTITYTVTGTDANGCQNTDQADVTVNPIPIVNADADQTVCEGTAVTLNGSGASGYVWDNGVTNGTPFVQGVGTITYTVTGTDGNGCQNTDQVDVTVNPLPIVNAGVDQTVCEGTAVTLSGAGATGYVWDNGVTDGVPFVQGVGTITYTVTGTDANGCQNTDQADMTVNPLPIVNAGADQTVCEGTAVTLNGSGATGYAWDNGVTDGAPFVPAVGTLTYTVIGTDVNGCQNTDQVDVTVNPLPIVSAGVNQTVCEGTAVTLNGAGANAYVWDNGITDGVPFVQGVGSITYTVIGTDVNGCQNTDQVDVTVNPLPIVSAGVDQTVCEGTAVTLNGAGAIGYAWDNGVTDGVPFVQGVGTITYTVIGTDANGCQNTDQADVTVNPLPIVSAGVDQTVCEGTAVTLNGAGANGYAWDNGVTDGVPFVQGVGTITYTVTGTDANGCQNTDQADVTVNPLPIVNAGVDQTVCEGTAITLNGSGANGYAWDNGVTDGTPFVQGVGTITYTVIGTDVNGCQNTDQADVRVNPNPVVGAGANQAACSGAAVILNGSGANGYVWDNGVSNNVPFVQGVGTITYTVIGTDLNGCQNTDQLDVTVYSLPNVNAGLDQTVCEGTAVTLNGSGANGYVWDNGVMDGVPFVQAVGSITYTLTGTDVNGCQNTDQMNVLVNPNPVINAGVDQSSCDGQWITLNATGAPSLIWDNAVVNNFPFQQGVGTTNYTVTGTLTTGCFATDAISVTVLQNPIVTTGDVVICEGEAAILSGAGAVSYLWTGGVENGQAFYPSQSDVYTVIGTAANGCSSEAQATVTVNQAPYVDFDVLNLHLTTTNPTTGFDNLSVGAVSYEWNFSDGSPINTQFEPIHTFPEDQPGEYIIELTGYSEFGCPARDIKYVHIFRDYLIYVPNAFTPDNSGVNEVFKPVMTGFDEQGYTMYIFNRWGNLIFETHDMQVGWDGTFRNVDTQVQDGVFTWKIEAKLKDSADTKIFVGHVSILK